MRKFLTLLLLLCFAPRALAWGREGHQIIADLAQRQLTPAAQREALRLLALQGNASLADVANWADDLRNSSPKIAGQTSRWHYLNFPRGDCAFAAARDCPKGDCVVAAINRYFLVLSDHSRADSDRLEALKFLVHFVGDVHQPLHAGFSDDRGGNDVQLSIGGQGTNLHQVWDAKMIAAREPDFHAYADLLARQLPLPFDATRRSDRPAVDWAQESCRIVAGADFYPRDRKLSLAYYDRQRATLDLRLRQAGNRLADMINYALKPRPTSAQ